MSRPIAYNASGPLSGSIRGANVNYIVDSGDRNFATFGGKKWVPSADGAAPIVFVTDTFTQGFQGDPSLAVPLFYSCNGTGSAAIIYTANRIPGSPGNYSDANVALNDLITARGYFILESNDPFQGGYQSGNLITLDASKMSSYPQVGTNLNDLSGNDFDFSLLNGPSFNSSGWFNMDGTDDSIGLAGNTTLKTTNTLVMWLRTTDTTGLLLTGNPPSTTGGQYVAAYSPGQGFYSGTAGSPVYFIDTLSTVDPATPINYLNGRFHMWEVKGLNLSGWTNDWYFLSYAAGYQIAGDVAKIQMFNSSLTSAQSKQLYFGAPIVTDGLVFAVDANNIVSYPKSGTSWYGLTGSINGTLVNGPTFNPLNGGSIVFDGTDDAVITNLTQTFINELTVETWYRGTKSTRNHLWNFYGSNLNCNFNDSSRTLWMYWEGGGSNAIRFTSPNFTDNNIHHLVFRHSGSTNQIYFDGQLLTPLETLGTQTFTGVGGSGYDIGGSPVFGGNVYTNRVYNKALSASEILQNYQAEQYRFQTPAGPVTNGLVLYWDAGNLDSYPGTGTTIYDLSGNSNNGTLLNGVGFNQVNGGVLTFDGVDDIVYSSTPNLAITNNTVMGAARYTGGVQGRMINAYGNNWLIGCWNNSTENYYAVGWVSPVQNGPSDTNWRIVTALGDVGADSYTSYVNNTLSSGPNNSGSAGPYGISVGAFGPGAGGGEHSAGQFSFVLVYNRVLTVTEMTQNYNFFKGRFGL